MTEQTAPAPTVWGTFQAHDARAMIEFLTALGFEATAVYADEGDPGVVHHAQLDWPEGGGVMFGSHKPEGWSLPPGGAGFYVVTADPRAVHDRAVQAGVEITAATAASPAGSDQVTPRCPCGSRPGFVQ